MQLSHKVRIFPTLDQERVLWDLSEKCRLVYNFALQERKENWEQEKDKPTKDQHCITYTKQQNDLPGLKIRFPEYTWPHSKSLQMALRTLDANYKSFFALRDNGHEDTQLPRFLKKRFFTTIIYNQSGFTLAENGTRLSFSHKHPSKTPLLFRLKYSFQPALPVYKVKQISISRKVWNGQARFFVSITYEFPEPQWEDNGKYLAIDLGVMNLISAINMKGKTLQFPNRRFDLFFKSKLAEVQSKRDHCKKGSRRWTRYNNAFKKMKRKCANQTLEFQRWVAQWIVTHTKANTIIIGDLAPKKMAKKTKGTGKAARNKANKTRHHSIQNTGSLGRFAQILSYKAQQYGKVVVVVSEHNTSKQCCCCGAMKKRYLSERTIECECGMSFDRDLNAAVNILARFFDDPTAVIRYMDKGKKPSKQVQLFTRPFVNGELFHNFVRQFTTILGSIQASSS